MKNDDKSELIYSTQNVSNGSTIAELQIWKPTQGTEWHSIPLLLDVLFGSHQVNFQKANLEVFAARAHLHLHLDGLEIIRGSKYGGERRAPYVVASVQEAVRETVEVENVRELSGGFSLLEGLRSKFVALYRRVRRRSKSKDFSLAADAKVMRVAETTGNRWIISEPFEGNVLRGRYLGIAGDSDVDEPLCFVSMFKEEGEATVCLSIDCDQLRYRSTGTSPLSRNKEAIIAAIGQREEPLKEILNATTLPFHVGPASIPVGISRLRVKKE